MRSHLIKCILFLTTLSFSSGFAAIPQVTPKDRVKVLQGEGKQGIKRLRSLAFDATQTVDVRWKALVTLAMVGGKDVLPEIEYAIQSSDWFMRDAGIKTLRKVDPSKALKWSRHLLSDPSLVVRTSAVTTLRSLKDGSSKSLLWEKLDSPQNFRGKQSLWIRHHIVRALSENAEKGEEQKFFKLLSDPDPRLHAPASLGLSKIYGVVPAYGNQSAEAFWKSRIQ